MLLLNFHLFFSLMCLLGVLLFPAAVVRHFLIKVGASLFVLLEDELGCG